jgi:tRNA modification GTPase
MEPDDTIAAWASGAGRSARALIRLSGPGVRLVLDSMVTPPLREAGAHAARFRLAGDCGRDFDLPCLLVLFGAPRSYTGEDAAEIQIPGNAALVERVLKRILTIEGTRLAHPGEFTARAFLNGRMTLDQAEGVQAAIAAGSEAELAAAERLLSGETGRAYRSLADEILRLLALVEAGIDFTDQEDVVPIEPRKLLHGLRNCLFGLDCFIEPAASEAPSSEPRVVLVGRPNAGKSTLFNALLGRRRSVMSESPGTTRDVVEERLELPAEGSAWAMRAVILADMAGLVEALGRSEADRAAQAAARQSIEHADLIIHCDPDGSFEDPGVSPGATPVLRVRTKADRPSVRSADTDGVIRVCALDGWNLAELKRAMGAALGGASAGAAHAGVVPRHQRALREARGALSRAIAAVTPDEHAPRLGSPELVASEIRLALDAMGEITGHVTADDVLGRVFAVFCVGK